MSELPEQIVAVVARVGSPDRPAFQLRKGEGGLMLLPTPGADVLPERLRTAHREIAPGPSMERPAFRAALKLLE